MTDTIINSLIFFIGWIIPNLNDYTYTWPSHMDFIIYLFVFFIYLFFTQEYLIHFDVGHESFVKDRLSVSGDTHNWSLFVRKNDNYNDNFYVNNVVFRFNEKFEYLTKSKIF